MSITIRSATVRDAQKLLEIYGYYVEHTAVSFELEAPALTEFERRIQTTLTRFPYLVALQDDVIIGYAYAGTFHPRHAFDHCCEVTVYLDRNARRLGVGRQLYEALEKRLVEMGIEISYALIALPTANDAYLDTNSRDFHAHLGYRQVGHLHGCGKKFGNTYDMIYMEKYLI